MGDTNGWMGKSITGGVAAKGCTCKTEKLIVTGCKRYVRYGLSQKEVGES